MKITHFYVLNGLQDGQDGIYAMTCSGDTLADGHYWLADGQSDPILEVGGPHLSKDDAVKAAKSWCGPWTIAVDVDGTKWRELAENDEVGEENVFSVERTDADEFVCTLVGSYETLDLKVSCPDLESVIEVYSALMQAQAKFV